MAKKPHPNYKRQEEENAVPSSSRELDPLPSH